MQTPLSKAFPPVVFLGKQSRKKSGVDASIVGQP
jgi:hypothetical protein